MLKIGHGKNTKICAFCSSWFDQGNSQIKPKSGDFWYYETNARKRCIKKKLDTNSWGSCSEFQSKL